MALEGTLGLHGQARQRLNAVSCDIANWIDCVSNTERSEAVGDAGSLGRTGCVSQLILLPFYPVLERLGIAARDLDLLLDRFLVHICHALGGDELGVGSRVQKCETARRRVRGRRKELAARRPRLERER